MLLRVIVALACLAATARAFLDDCPIDRGRQVADVPLVDALETFYRDLVFVRAATDWRQARDYAELVDEISDMAADPERETIAAARAYGLFSEIVRALEEGRVRDADTLVWENGAEAFIDDWILTYFYLLEAETKRLMGEHEEAAKAALTAFLGRRHSRGVSMNVLERLDGLIALQAVSHFNRDLDRLYGLRQSPDYALLRLVHLAARGALAPLDDTRTAIYDRLYHTAPRLGAFDADDELYRVERLVEPGLDEFRGHSVAKATAEAVLCEFAQKLEVVAEDAKRNLTAADYANVIDQLRRLDAEAARDLHDRVVSLVDTDLGLARERAADLWNDYYSASYDQGDVKAIFVAYLHLELNHLQSDEGCNIWALDSLFFAKFMLTDLRRDNDGLSLDKLAELRAKVVLHWLGCFHRRLALAYGLGGAETDAQREVARAALGKSCLRTLPDSDMLQ